MPCEARISKSLDTWGQWGSVSLMSTVPILLRAQAVGMGLPGPRLGSMSLMILALSSVSARAGGRRGTTQAAVSQGLSHGCPTSLYAASVP